MKKILCVIGLHKYKEMEKAPLHNQTLMQCERCPKRKIVIHAILESDLYRMLKDGTISHAAYLASVKQGYTDAKTLSLKNEDYVEEFMFGSKDRRNE